ncbi:hypothetical protein Cabys_1655 [Caldithrix abyssi DSM 13497]|uniref:Uncharacterized protein n=1 Tax=Caldithrix abyssi DSM 13497 TaxID=880073 RepID=A0A1J1C7M6_CALAY|nr:hypothetical protein Cabys_1655 [Caldithrix abyssi DSM 13497]
MVLKFTVAKIYTCWDKKGNFFIRWNKFDSFGINFYYFK